MVTVQKLAQLGVQLLLLLLLLQAVAWRVSSVPAVVRANASIVPRVLSSIRLCILRTDSLRRAERLHGISDCR